jgi:uncharacterized LabA/DUF88 family protein
VAEERLKLAVFIDFDNIQIGVKDTLGKEFDVSVVLEALKERGEVVTKVAYGDWPRASEHSRQMTQHAVQMVQRNVTPRGDKNGADINLALDALEMAFTKHHINSFAIVGGDSDFIALVEKLKMYDKRVLVVGGRAFTSNILQRNCTEFIAYENLLRPSAPSPRARGSRRGEPARASLEARPLSDALLNVRRAIGLLAEREVLPQLGLLKSTLLQLDSTFSERDYGAGSFLEFVQKMERAGLVHLRKVDRGYLVEILDGAGPAAPAAAREEPRTEAAEAPTEAAAEAPTEASAEAATESTAGPSFTGEQALEILRRAIESETDKSPNRPLYLRHIRHGLRAVDKDFDERRAGFQRLTDLLHRAQREGWLSMQRDRNGVLRMFYRPAVEGTAPSPAGAVEAPVQGEVAASTDFWQSDETVAFAAPEGEPAPVREAQAGLFPAEIPKPASEEAGPDEPAAATRKTRPRKPAKTGQRRSAGRRKTKNSAE